MLIWGLIAVTSITVGVLIGWFITIGTRRRLKHLVHFLQTLIAQEPAGLFYQDLNGKVGFCSHSLAQLFNLKTPIKWDEIINCFAKDAAAELDTAHQKLLQKGAGFSLLLQNKTAQYFMITGRVVHTIKHQGILILFQNVSDMAQKLHLTTLMEQHKNILAQAMDAFSFPLFIRDTNGLTFFANHAVNQEKTEALNDLSWLSIPFESDHAFYTLTYGRDTKTEEELNLILSNMLSAQRKFCEHLPCAVCLFNASGQLLACSDAFAALWQLDKKWVQSTPSYEDYWDIIQDNGLLSRVADFANYKKQQRENFAKLTGVSDLFLYLPNGKIIHRTMIPSVQGCVILLDEEQPNTKK